MRWSEMPYKRDIEEYVNAIVEKLRPKLVLLHGSVAKGTFGLGSDVDIFIVAEKLPKNLNARLELLYSLDRTRAPIDVKAYTPDEVRRMLSKGHPLIMDALEDGRVLYADGEYLEEILREFREAKRRFRRFERGWIRVEG
ncbi:nucleotidyltransferase domain-containing protein [Thermococcus zilligii]|uniref:nucleotidyltransferase domain-containing protein n=1 Tax=Thermococcus zilligii TaxID=54076 RepID=UPI001ED941DC|nr:nucleotidyltransferase domain-containing protein [Thermococcus zilligii]